MCVAGLNVSTQSCSHRWYQLVRSCSTERNLANCPDKLRFEGWENRNETCPWCDATADEEVSASTHRLFGNPSGPFLPLSPVPEPYMTRQQRSSSINTLSSISTLSRTGSTGSIPPVERGLRQRELNDRFHLYLTAQPHEVLPSARKNYPTESREQSTDSDAASVVSGRSMLRGWKKTVRFSRGIFRG